MNGIQMSMFDAVDLEQEELREVLRRGSGFEGGPLRIYAAWNLLEWNRFVMFLGDEFGVGGHSIRDGFCDYNGKGLEIRRWRSGYEKRYTWKRIAEEYDG